MSVINKGILMVLLLLNVFALTGCVGKDGGKEVSILTSKEFAFEIIKAYSNDSTRKVPNLQDYKDAGLVDLIEEKVGLINQEVQKLDPKQVDTIIELIAIAEKINIAPIIRFNEPLEVTVNKTINIKPEVSDLDGSVVKYEWVINSEIQPQHIEKNINYKPVTVGTDVLTLKVTDDKDKTTSETVKVFVIEDAMPTVDAGEDKTVKAGKKLLLLGIGADKEGVVKYKWLEGSKVLAETVEFEYVSSIVGDHVLKLVVTDDAEQTGEDELKVIVTSTIEEPNQLPTANAGQDMTVEIGKSILLVGEGRDNDGTVEKFTWKKGGEILSSTKSFNYTPTKEGTDLLELVVMDNDNGMASDTVNIIVKGEGEGEGLKVDAGADMTIHEKKTISVTAKTENNKGKVTYRWVLEQELISESATLAYNIKKVGAYVFKLTVKEEGSGKSAEDDLVINVTDNSPPVITINGEESIELIKGEQYIDQGASAKDDFDDGAVEVETSTYLQDISNAAAGSHVTITYTAKDSKGNATTKVRTVNIIAPNNGPHISLKGLVNTHVYKGTTFHDGGAYATKNSIGDLNYRMVVGGDTVNTNAPVNTLFTISYDVTDTDGEKAITRYRYVKVVALGSNLVPAIDEADKELMLGIVNKKRSAGLACNGFKAVPELTWNNNLYGSAYELSQDQGESGGLSLGQGSGTIYDWTGYAIGRKSSPAERNHRHGYTGGTSFLLSGTRFYQFGNELEYLLANDLNCRAFMSPSYTDLGASIYYKQGNFFSMSFVIQLGQH